MDFVQLGLCAPLVQAVAEQGYTVPSPIQEKAIPPVLAGRDLLGCAQTGTGKTAAFSLPLLQRLHAGARKPLRALILTPTRELALQIHESITAYAAHLPLSCCVIFGGVGQGSQVEALRKKPDILVATPGRLNDLIGQGIISLKNIEAFVLDEADRMLDMGFIHDVRRVLSQLPAQRQTLLFSATMPPAIEQLAAGMLKDPAVVKVAPPSTTVEAIRQQLYHTDKPSKRALLAWLLKERRPYSTLVFTRTKHGADRVARNLTKDGFPAAAIHGDKSQNARQRALGDFKAGKIGVLVATDIAARGIDITGLDLVVNFDLPNEPETYVHRIGRTGRAGAAGEAVSFCCADERGQLADIEKLIRRCIPVCEDHPFPAQDAPAPAAPVQPAPPPKRNEVTDMEETKATGSAPCRRRRRGKKPGSAAPAAPAPAETARPAREKNQQPRQNQKAPARGGRPERSERPARPERSRQNQRPARTAGRPTVPPRAEEDEDAGLLLITRKAPAVKYASFEEYMKNHVHSSDLDSENEE